VTYRDREKYNTFFYLHRALLRLLLTDVLQHMIIFGATVVYNVSILHIKFAGTNTGTLQLQSIHDSSSLFIFFSPTEHTLLETDVFAVSLFVMEITTRVY
jgi:hypothetical protein